ncbi:probable G-protein coupled receptor 139 [Haliotis asinina]|uniref:probable G-protein coupled receptor 139 n=1 Tax=Haliotis asinina TaxID=109174 RepID=UPI0035322074
MDSVDIVNMLAFIGFLLCLLGIIGNSMSVYVLSKLNSKPLRLLKYLNVVDIGLLVVICFALMMVVLGMERLVSDFTLVLVLRCIAPLFSTLQTFGTYLTVLIAFVRCLAVAMPFRFSTCMRDTVQNKLLIAVAVFSLLFSVPLFLLWTPTISWSSFDDIQMVVAFHLKYLSQVFLCILPILIIVICNVILAVSRCRMRSFTSQNNQCRSPDRGNRRGAFQLTCLVIAITAMFTTTHGLVGVYKVVVLASDSPQVSLQVVCFSVLMTIINSATNFIFYCLIGSEFRTTMISLCKKPCIRRNRPMPVSSV